jgi:hypothetical protein
MKKLLWANNFLPKFDGPQALHFFSLHGSAYTYKAHLLDFRILYFVYFQMYFLYSCIYEQKINETKHCSYYKIE